VIDFTKDWYVPEGLEWNIGLETPDEEQNLNDAKMVYYIFRGAHEVPPKYHNGDYSKILRLAVIHIWFAPRGARPSLSKHRVSWSKEARDQYFNLPKNKHAGKFRGEHIISAKTITEALLKQMDNIRNEADMLKALQIIHKKPYFVVITHSEDKLLGRGDGWERYEKAGIGNVNDYMPLAKDPRFKA
jgi:hypothetical protein